jgi:hypothetical protein
LSGEGALASLIFLPQYLTSGAAPQLFQLNTKLSKYLYFQVKNFLTKKSQTKGPETNINYYK